MQTVVGGTNVKTDASRLRNKPPHILVATPGRLDDLLKQGALSRQAIGRLQTLIFDEGDRLMDMGFRCESCCKVGQPQAARRCLWHRPRQEWL